MREPILILGLSVSPLLYIKLDVELKVKLIIKFDIDCLKLKAIVSFVSGFVKQFILNFLLAIGHFDGPMFFDIQTLNLVQRCLMSTV